MKIETANQISGQLRARGYSVAGWAKQNGYHPRTVHHCIKMFAPITGDAPKRPLAKEIMNKLSEELGVNLVEKSDD